jgi:hypothetical protein
LPCNSMLCSSACRHLVQVLITQVHYFKGCNESFLMECAMHMEEVVFAPMEVAVVRGRIVTHLTIIRRGVIVAKGRVLTPGRVIGEESLYKECPASYSARCMTYTDVSQLHRTVLLQILKNFPVLLRSFCIRSIQGVFRCTCAHLVHMGATAMHLRVSVIHQQPDHWLGLHQYYYLFIAIMEMRQGHMQRGSARLC